MYAPVSAMMRFLPRRLASRAWPTALLILWAPVIEGGEGEERVMLG